MATYNNIKKIKIGDNVFELADKDTTYTLSGALSSHKFTSTLTAGGSGSGTSTSDFTLAAGDNIALTDDTSNRKITIEANNTWREIQVNGARALAGTPGTNALNLKAGTGISLANSSGTITITNSSTNTDEKVKVEALTSGTVYYPILATDTGTAIRQIDSTIKGLRYRSEAGTTTSQGFAQLIVGNGYGTGDVNNESGVLVLYGVDAYAFHIGGNATAHRELTLPDASGTLALNTKASTTEDGLMKSEDYVKLAGITENAAAVQIVRW